MTPQRSKVACALAATVAIYTPAAADLDGPIAHWRFDEAGGTLASDSAGAFHGVLSGSAELVPGAGIAGGALRLWRHNNGHVRIGDVLPLGGEARFTISAWVRLTATTPEQVVIGRYAPVVQGGYFLAVNQGGGHFGAAGRAWFYASRPPGNEPISATVVTDGAWHHIVITSRPGLARIYVDGAPAEDSAVAWPIPQTPAPLLIGGLAVGPAGVGAFEGFLDDIQIYSTVLTDAQIDALAAAPGAILPARCRPDLTHGAIPGGPGFGMPDCILDSNDFFYYLAQFAAGNLAVADLTTTAIPGSPGHGVPNGILNSDDLFYYLALYAAGC